jgi:hypothetical protein
MAIFVVPAGPIPPFTNGYHQDVESWKARVFQESGQSSIVLDSSASILLIL